MTLAQPNLVRHGEPAGQRVGGLRADSEADLAMLVSYGGRERRIDEFRALADGHGLVPDAVTALTDQPCLLAFRRAGAGPARIV